MATRAAKRRQLRKPKSRAKAKAKPGMTFSSPGIGTTPHLSGELLKRMAGVELTHVPYRGAAAGAVTDAIAGRVDAIFNTAA